jgi:hypothetical protein
VSRGDHRRAQRLGRGSSDALDRDGGNHRAEPSRRGQDGVVHRRDREAQAKDPQERGELGVACLSQQVCDPGDREPDDEGDQDGEGQQWGEGSDQRPSQGEAIAGDQDPGYGSHHALVESQDDETRRDGEERHRFEE